MSDLTDRLRNQATDAIAWEGEVMKRWDEIRHMCEIHKGGDLPRLMFEDLVDDFAGLLMEAADRIKELELQDEIKLQASTIWMNRSAIWMDRALAAEARIAELLQGGT